MKNIKNILVIGLDNFGASMIKELSKYNCEILAVDKNMQRVEEVDKFATYSLNLDVKDVKALKSLSLDNYDIAVISIDNIETSIMIAMILKEEGIPQLIVKSSNSIHTKILEKIGVDRIISPEDEMGIKVAKSIMNKNIVDIVNFSPDYTMLEIPVLKNWVDHKLKDLNLRKKYGINILCVKKENMKLDISPLPEYVLEKNSMILTIVENEKFYNSDIAKKLVDKE